MDFLYKPTSTILFFAFAFGIVIHFSAKIRNCSSPPNCSNTRRCSVIDRFFCAPSPAPLKTFIDLAMSVFAPDNSLTIISCCAKASRNLTRSGIASWPACAFAIISSMRKRLASCTVTSAAILFANSSPPMALVIGLPLNIWSSTFAATPRSAASSYKLCIVRGPTGGKSLDTAWIVAFNSSEL